MKASLSLIISYIFLCIVGTAVCAALFMVLASLHSFVIGESLSIVSATLFFDGVLFSAPAVAVASLVLLILRTIRWRNVSAFGSILSFIFYILIGIGLWGFALPKFFSYTAEQFSQIQQKNESTKVSSGYFRRQNDKIFYYSRVLPNENADGVFLEENGVPSYAERFSDLPVNVEKSDSYSDILVREAVKTSFFAGEAIEIYKTILFNAQKSLQDGQFSWILFSTLGLSLLSLYAFRFASTWRLASATSVVFGAIFVVLVNYFCFAQKIPAVVLDFYKYLPAIFQKYSISVYFNVLFAVVLCFFGIIKLILRIKRERVLREGEK